MSAVDETYNTTDFYITAILITKKFIVKQVTKEGYNNKTRRFHFDDSPELREVVLAYMNRTLEGNLKEFKDAIETVKDLVHNV